MMTQQEKNTAAFIADYRLTLSLEYASKKCDFMEGIPDNSTARPAPGIVHPFDLAIQKGDIRMLSQTDELTYGVVLPWDNCHWLFVPYSHCKFPVNSEEMMAEDYENRPAFQKVLQGWNARTINALLLMRSWKVGRVSEEELERIRTLMKHCWLNEKLPEELKALTSLPIKDSKDIRCYFKANEFRNFKELDAENADLEAGERFLDGLRNNLCVPTPGTGYHWLQFAEAIGQLECDTPQLAAAGGDNRLSEVWDCQKKCCIGHLECVSRTFHGADADQELPSALRWESQNWPVPVEDWASHAVFFFHRKTRQFLGCSVMEKVRQNGCRLLLRARNDEALKEPVRSASDIVIALM